MDAHVRRSLSEHIQDIEHATGCFICSACCTSSINVANRTTFSCSDAAAFLSHLSTQHPRLRTIICIYCSLPVESSQSASHMTSHFFPTETIKTTDIFVCPAEPNCSQHFASTHPTSMQVHWTTHHANTEADEEQQPWFTCSHCRLCTFTSLHDWIEHIQRYTYPLVHCGVSGCLVKSPSKSLLLEHIARKHSGPTEMTFTDISALIYETFEVSIPHILSFSTQSFFGHVQFHLY